MFHMPPKVYPNNGNLNLDGLTTGQGIRFYVSDRELSGSKGFIRMQSITKTLFEKAPSSGDIYQSCSIGNCYLLSALLSILEDPSGATIINNMITDLGNKRIMVHLFNTFSEYPISCYIELDKTIFLDELDLIKGPDGFELSKNCHKAHWVYYIEKAYAAYRIKFSQEHLRKYGCDINSIEKQRKYPNASGVMPDKLTLVRALSVGHASEVYDAIFGSRRGYLTTITNLTYTPNIQS